MFLANALTKGIHPPENIQNGGRSKNRVWRLTKAGFPLQSYRSEAYFFVS
jgi:hypothetical protein